jgi:1-deoxy-D-xylulose-5-phosphate synthase
MPNMILMAPKDENELRRMLMTALYSGHPAALRYPRGSGLGVPLESPITAIPIGEGELLLEGSDLVIAAIGTMVETAMKVAISLNEEGISCAVVNARFVKPLDTNLLLEWSNRTRAVVTMEEGCAPGGFGSAVGECLTEHGVLRPRLHCAVPDRIVPHGSHKRLMDEQGLSPEALQKRIKAFLLREGVIQHVQPRPHETEPSSLA